MASNSTEIESDLPFDSMLRLRATTYNAIKSIPVHLKEKQLKLWVMERHHKNKSLALVNI